MEAAVSAASMFAADAGVRTLIGFGKTHCVLRRPQGGSAAQRKTEWREL